MSALGATTPPGAATPLSLELVDLPLKVFELVCFWVFGALL
jgi:hypothetical protein